MQDQTIPAPPQTHQPWPDRPMPGPMPGLSPRPEQATNPQAQRQQEQAQQ